MSYIPRLKNEYKGNVVTRLMKEFSYDNVMQVPKLEKIVISKGVGAAVNDKKLIDHALNEITDISGQKAIATMSKNCLLYTSPSPRDKRQSRMPSSA